MEFPPDLRAALDALSPGDVRATTRTAERLSHRYRHDSGNPRGLSVRSEGEALAYAHYRFPATYSAVWSALTQVREACPDWQPHTLLDAGAGSGAATWAATQVWPGLRQMHLVEQNRHMMALGRRLASEARSSGLQEAAWRQLDLTQPWSLETSDLVVIAYVLGEVDERKREEVVARLWAVCRDTMVIIEPGTPSGSRMVQDARNLLRNLGGGTIAPCPHNDLCPLATTDWCHFSQRLPRSRIHRQLKGGQLAYEDEKFSFVALSRTLAAAPAARVVRHPQLRPGHVYLDLCTPEGIERRVVSRREGPAFRQARSLHWGDAIRSDGTLERSREAVHRRADGESSRHTETQGEGVTD